MQLDTSKAIHERAEAFTTECAQIAMSCLFFLKESAWHLNMSKIY